MKNFIEIGSTEEEQAEKIKHWLRSNGPQIVVGVVLGLGGIWGWKGYTTYQNSQSIEARTYYNQLVSNPNNPQFFEILQRDYASSIYTHQATLVLAKHAVKAKNYQRALDYIAPLLHNENALIADIAKLRSAQLYLEMGQHDPALTMLGTENDNAFNGLYNQARGDIYADLGKNKRAQKHYQLALQQSAPESEFKTILQMQINDLNEF